MIKTKLLTTMFLVVCYLSVNAQTTNTSPLPTGETIIGNHLHAGAGNEVWTDATSLFFNYRGSGGATYFWNLGGGTGKSIMTLLNNGNVGIGTDNPQSKLEVSGDIKTNGTMASSSYFLSRCNGGSGLVLQNNGAGANLAIAELSCNSYSLGFNTGIGGQISPVLTWNASGNVGIGTTNPNEKLEIGGNLRINNGENCTILPTGHSLTFGGRQDYAHVSYIFRPSWGTPSSTYSNFQLQNATNTGTFTTAVMFTTDGGNSYVNSGNFGIGTINPQYKLDVSGDGRIGNLSARHYMKIASTEWPEIRFETPLSDEKIRIGVAHEDNSSYRVQEGDLYFFTRDINAMPFILRKSGNILLNTTFGNVGIGTTNPTYKLDVLGTIRAKEVLVNLDGGADFVFEKDYKLPSIEHVANYVQENKHLPDIPSANEMTKNGVSMGDMQVKLLQKVEELTLYAIQQDKSKKELERKYNALLEKVEMLTKQIERK